MGIQSLVVEQNKQKVGWPIKRKTEDIKTVAGKELEETYFQQLKNYSLRRRRKRRRSRNKEGEEEGEGEEKGKWEGEGKGEGEGEGEEEEEGEREGEYKEIVLSKW